MKLTRPIKFIILTCISAVFSVIVLAAIVDLFTNKPTGFSRILNGLMDKPTHLIKIPTDAISIVGTNDGKIILKTKKPHQLYSYELNLGQPDTITLKLPGVPPSTRNISHEVMDNIIFTFAGDQKKIFANDLTKDSQFVATKLPNSFTRGISLSKGSYIIRAFDPAAKEKDQYFIKTENDSRISSFNRSTPRFYDAGIATDGMLDYDTIKHIVTYTYFYSNRILCMDTTLRHLYTMNTIDTFANYYNGTIEIEERTGTSKITYDRPPQLANLNQTISKGLLYNLSLIKADNERVDDFKEKSVVDVYDIGKAKYLYSFYIPNVKKKKVRAIYVYNNIIIALYNGYLATFSLRLF